MSVAPRLVVGFLRDELPVPILTKIHGKTAELIVPAFVASTTTAIKPIFASEG